MPHLVSGRTGTKIQVCWIQTPSLVYHTCCPVTPVYVFYFVKWCRKRKMASGTEWAGLNALPFPICALDAPFPVTPLSSAARQHCPGKCRKAEGEKWGSPVPLNTLTVTPLPGRYKEASLWHPHTAGTAASSVSATNAEVNHPFAWPFLWRHWSSGVDRAVRKYQAPGTAELASNQPFFEHKATAWRTPVIFLWH